MTPAERKAFEIMNRRWLKSVMMLRGVFKRAQIL